MNNPFDDLLELNGHWIQVYLGIEAVDDPFEKNVITTTINPISIKALVTDHASSKAQWIMPGIVVSKIKEIYVAKKYRSLIEASQKFGIRNSMGVTEFFEGWREDGHMQITEEDASLRLYVYSKHT